MSREVTPAVRRLAEQLRRLPDRQKRTQLIAVMAPLLAEWELQWLRANSEPS